MHHARFAQDALLLGGSLASASSMAFPWPDWATIVGPASGLVVSLIMLSVFVKHSRDRITREDARHEAELASRAKHAKDFMRLQVATNRTLNNVANALSKRPCLCKDKIEIEDVTFDEDNKPTTDQPAP